MRLRALLNYKELPILYRHKVLSLIKSALEKSDKEYFESLYASKKPRPFTFAVLVAKGSRLEGDVFYSEKPHTLWVSSFDSKFIVKLYNGLLEEEDVKSIEVKAGKEIKRGEILCKTMSPILIERDGDNPLREENFERFNIYLNLIEEKVIKALLGRGLKRELRFEPVDWKVVVVKHTLDGIREGLGKPYAYFTCFDGYFRLSGHPEDLQFLYDKGIGLRTSQGFGMVEVL